MVSEEILDQLYKLDRANKLRIIQLLAADLAAEEDEILVHRAHYEVRSPFDGAGAAEKLTKILFPARD